jgi:hypothetical protein
MARIADSNTCQLLRRVDSKGSNKLPPTSGMPLNGLLEQAPLGEEV